MIMKRIYDCGLTTTSGGNISILDDDGTVWITPGSIDKGNLHRNDIVQVKSDGTINGIHKPSMELPIHKLIYAKRPDIKAVVHAHSPALVSFSIVGIIPNTKLIPNINLVCGEVGMAGYGLPGSIELGEIVSEVFEKGYDAVLLKNHGIAVGAENLMKAFMAFETLDFCAKLEINANRIGKPNSLTPKYLNISRKKTMTSLKEYQSDKYTSGEQEIRSDMCDFISRAYSQKLFNSAQGTFSQRLDENEFLITPYMADRNNIAPEDIVKVKNGRVEAGKQPSRSVLLHKYIYEKHPHINSVIIAQPPNIMAFAVTQNEYDTRIIPESYIQLRNIEKYPFGSSLMQPAMFADIFSKDKPAAIVENDCIIVTGSSMLNAFDRLEVAEFGAKAVIEASSIGKIMSISEHEISDIVKAFKLD
ncbi:MAG: class II aldolase/adducin family protein [Bacillota bacterium]|nr:class II aldolase/adducin family protein [Bacillota bacterium]